MGRIVQRMLTIVDMPEIRVRETEKQSHNGRNVQIADAGGKADSYRREFGFSDTIAEFCVEDDHVRLELEIGSNDVGSFRNLLPDSLYQ